MEYALNSTLFHVARIACSNIFSGLTTQHAKLSLVAVDSHSSVISQHLSILSCAGRMALPFIMHLHVSMLTIVAFHIDSNQM